MQTSTGDNTTPTNCTHEDVPSPITIADKQLIQSFLESSASAAARPSSDSSFISQLAWDPSQRFLLVDHSRSLVFLTKSKGEVVLTGDVFGPSSVAAVLASLPPPVRASLAGWDSFTQHTKAQLETLSLSLSRSRSLSLDDNERIQVRANRDDFDYVYSVDALADLPGHKYMKKRKYARICAQEQQAYWEPITSEQIAHSDCLDLLNRWHANKSQDQDHDQDQDHEDTTTMEAEFNGIKEILLHWGELQPLVFGGVIRSGTLGGTVIAFSLFERLSSDTAVCHAEKMDTVTAPGIGQLINQWSAEKLLRPMGFKWVNREDDLGNPGLREAKMGYYPDHWVEKFTCRFHLVSQQPSSSATGVSASSSSSSPSSSALIITPVKHEPAH